MYQVRYPITIWLTNKMAIGKQRELTTFNRMKSEHEWAHAQNPHRSVSHCRRSNDGKMCLCIVSLENRSCAARRVCLMNRAFSIFVVICTSIDGFCARFWFLFSHCMLAHTSQSKHSFGIIIFLMVFHFERK